MNTLDELAKFETAIADLIGLIVEDCVGSAPAIEAGVADRPGAALGGRLAELFVDRAKNCKCIYQPEAPEAGRTKNPWDARFFLSLDSVNEEVWLDFKALDQAAADSNPDSGSIDKFSKFIASGKFYFYFVRTFFDRDTDGRIVHVQRAGRWCNVFQLRDIPDGFRRTSANQLQMSAYASTHTRTREAFLKDLYSAAQRDYQREISRLQGKLARLEETKATSISAARKSQERLAGSLEALATRDRDWVTRLTITKSNSP